METSSSCIATGYNSAENGNTFKFKYLSEAKYALPLVINRSALFAPIEYRGANGALRPTFTEPTLIGSWGEHSKVYQTAGERLTQVSKAVYIELVRMAINSEFAPSQRIVVSFSVNDMLRAIGTKPGTKSRLLLSRELNRMKRASFMFIVKEMSWETGLISNVLIDNRNPHAHSASQFTIEMNPEMIAVFNSGAKLLDLEIHTRLRALKDSLAMWLYDFYETHDNYPLPITEQKLKALTGRAQLLNSSGKQINSAQQRSRWLTDLKASLSNLEKMTGWNCYLENGKVIIKKTSVPQVSKKKSSFHQYDVEDYDDDI